MPKTIFLPLLGHVFWEGQKPLFYHFGYMAPEGDTNNVIRFFRPIRPPQKIRKMNKNRLTSLFFKSQSHHYLFNVGSHLCRTGVRFFIVPSLGLPRGCLLSISEAVAARRLLRFPPAAAWRFPQSQGLGFIKDTGP